MTTIDDVLRSKANTEIWTIAPTATVYQALEVLAEKNIGALPVVEGDRLVGLFSERDYARKVFLKGKCSLDTAVEEIMVHDLITVRPQHTIKDCMVLMTENHIRHLLVVDGEHLVGIVSMRDLVERIISRQENTIESLENYITGTDYGK